MPISVATLTDIDEVLELQKKYHVNFIAELDRPDGFVTTLFTKNQLVDLITTENGLVLARKDGRLVAYAMAASWSFWSQWPFFAHMIDELKTMAFDGQSLTTANSYQYGPVCIDTSARGTGLLESIFDASRATMAARYPLLVTFINKVNTRSFAAHTRKLGLKVVHEFEFNGSQYHALALATNGK